MTVYQPIIQIAETAAELAVPIAQGKEPPADLAGEQGRQRPREDPVGAARHDRDPRRTTSRAPWSRTASSTSARSAPAPTRRPARRPACSEPGRRSRSTPDRPRSGPRSTTASAARWSRPPPASCGWGPGSARGGGAARCWRRSPGSAAPGPGAARRRGAVRLRGGDRGGAAAVGELLRRGARPRAASTIASDGVTSLLGALGERDGAVVAAGTGTICVARRGERLAKVDGWGALLGDAGSGFAIGRAGLEAALRNADGRGGSEAPARRPSGATRPCRICLRASTARRCPHAQWRRSPSTWQARPRSAMLRRWRS